MTTGKEQQVLSSNYILLLVKDWKLIVAAAIVCAFLSTAVHLASPKIYESSAMVLLYPPYFKISGTEAARRIMTPGKTPVLPAEDLSELMPQMLPIETYKRIAEAPEIFQAIITKLKLDDADVKDLQDKCTLELTPLGSRTPQYGTRYSQTMLFRAKWKTGELAASIVQTWMDIFKERVDKLNQTGLAETHALVQSMWETTKTDLDLAEDNLREFQVKWDIQLLEAQREAKIETLNMLETDLVRVEIDLAKQGAVVESLRADLKNEPKKDVLFRAPSDDAYWLSGGGKPDAEGSGFDSTTGLRTEEINPNYTVARDLEILAASELAGLDKQKSNTQLKVERLVEEIDELYDTIVTQGTEEKRLQRVVEVMEQTFELAASSLEKSKLARVNETSDLQIVANAVIPGRSTRTSPLITVFMAALLGGSLGTAYILARDTVFQMTASTISATDQ